MLTFCSNFSAQKQLPMDTLKLKSVDDFWTDDYGGFYFLNREKLSFTKFDSLGKKIGEMLWAVPFQIQSVVNPLTIPLFSESSQELRFVDQNLNDIQDPIRQGDGFTHAKAVYVEDLQFLWVVDDAQKTLSKYDYRNKSVIKSFVFSQNFDQLKSIIVHRNKVYFCKNNSFEIYDLNQNKILSKDFVNLKSIERRNQDFYLNFSDKILKYTDEGKWETVFTDAKARLVSRNFQNWFAIEANKLYLYTPKN